MTFLCVTRKLSFIMLKIRLSRTGKNKFATYRVVVTEHTNPVKGKAMEVLGSYNPHSDKANLKADRIKHWISVGATVSPTVHNLLIDEKVIEGKKVTAWKPPKKEVKQEEAPKTEAAPEKPVEEQPK